jgi:hypothetical protein
MSTRVFFSLFLSVITACGAKDSDDDTAATGTELENSALPQQEGRWAVTDGSWSDDPVQWSDDHAYPDITGDQ